MALVVKDRVRETTATTGTGTLTLGGAVSGFQDFSVIGNGNTTYYAIVDAATGSWEVGLGTYTSSGTTLSRDTVLESSNNGNLVPFLSGTKDVFCTYPAERSVYVDGSSIVPATAATLPTVSGGTGLTSFTTNQVFYASSTSAMGQSANLTFDGTTLTANTLTVSTGATTVPAGTVSAPAITTSGDTNTGIYFPAADTIAFTEGGVESMRIDSAGNVGIGTTSPTSYSSAGRILAVVSTTPSLSSGGIVNYDAQAAAADVGGVITLGGQDGTIANRAFAAFKGGKENATSGNFASYAAFATRANGGVMTERMRIDSSGNVGIGTTSPAYRLDVAKSGDAAWIRVGDSTLNGGAGVIFKGASNSVKNWVIANQYNVNGGLEFTQTTANGGSTIGSTPAMTLDASGNLGIGTTSPRAKTDIYDGNVSAAFNANTLSTWNVLQVRNNITGVSGTAAGIALGGAGTVTAPAGIVGINDNTTGGICQLAFLTSSSNVSAERMRLDSSGNLGLGVTPSAWNSAYKAIQFSSTYCAISANAGNSVDMNWSWNARATGNNTWAYIGTGDVARLYQVATGGFTWNLAPAGTAGNAITFTQAMTLDASGNFLVGTTTPSSIAASGRGLIEVNGSSDSAFAMKAGGTLYGYLFTSASEMRIANITANPVTFYTNNTERMRIASDGVITSTLGGMQVISGTSVSASTTAVQFTGLPSWVKRITIMLSSVSTNGSSGYIVQLGTGSTPTYVTSGYLGSIGNAGAGSASLITAGFGITGTLTSASTVSGAIRITLLSSSSNTWTHASVVGLSDAAGAYIGGSSISLASVLTAVRVTTVTGVNTFDTGTINILYE